MAKFKAFKTIDIGSVSAGGSTEKTWTSDGDYIIHRIRLVEKTGASLYKYTATITISGEETETITKDIVPGHCLSGHWNQVPVLDLDLKDSWVFKISVSNDESAARDVYCVLELHQ